MGMILRIASSRIVGQGDIVGRSGYFSLNLSANSVMRGRLDARRTLKSLVADLRYVKMKRIIQAYKKTDKSSEHFSEEDWKQLIAETDMRWNNITLRLATRYPLSQNEIHLCCLYLTDIPTSHFRYIMECSRDAIYKKTKKILEQKIECSDKSTTLRDILENFL